MDGRKLGLYDGTTGALLETRDLDDDGKVIGEPLSASTGQWLYLFTSADQTLQPVAVGEATVSQLVRLSNERVPTAIPFDGWNPFKDWECL